MATIRNNTLTTHLVYDNSGISIRFLPGINLLVPSEIVDLIKDQPGIGYLFKTGEFEILQNADNKQVYLDEQTGITFVDDNGEKIPITKTSLNGENSLALSGKQFQMSDLKSAGLSNQLANKILSQTPESGWKDADAIISAFDLTGKSADSVNGLF
jgi:hypothetical protein